MFIIYLLYMSIITIIKYIEMSGMICINIHVYVYIHIDIFVYLCRYSYILWYLKNLLSPLTLE